MRSARRGRQRAESAIVPVNTREQDLMVASTGRLLRNAAGAAHWTPFAGAASIFVLAFIGLAYSLFPYVVIDRLTFWDAAAHPSSLKVVLAGAAIVLPFIIGYTAFSYYLFRGKARPGLYD